MGDSDSESSSPPQQLTLPDCSKAKTRRRKGQALRRRAEKATLVVPDMPPDVTRILKALARNEKISYAQLCRTVLQNHAYTAVNPGRRR